MSTVTRITRSRSRSAQRTLPEDAAAGDKRKRNEDGLSNGSDDGAQHSLKIAKIDEEANGTDDDVVDDVDMATQPQPQPTSAATASSTKRKSSAAGSEAELSKKAKAAPARSSLAPTASVSLRPPSSATQRSRSASSSRSNPSSFVSPSLIGAPHTASLHVPTSRASIRRPSLPAPSSSTTHRPSPTSSSSSSSSPSSSSSQPPPDSTWQLKLNLERLAQIRRELKPDGAGDFLALLDRIAAAAYSDDAHTPTSLTSLSDLHDDLLKAMHQLSSASSSSSLSPSSSAGLLGPRLLPRSLSSLQSSDALLSSNLPSLITTDLTAAHKLLLLSPSRVNQPDSLGNTALSYAVLTHDLPLIAYLCSLRADPNQLNHSSLSPLSLARLNHIPTTSMLPLGLCSCSASGRAVVAQEFWTCETCGLMGDRGVCDVCAVKCHKGHVMRTVAVASEGFCDCYGTEGCQAKTVAGLMEGKEEDGAGGAADVAAVPFSFSALTSDDALTKENARGLLRLMERVVLDTASIAHHKGRLQVDEGAGVEGEAVQGEEAEVGVRDVLVGVGVTAVLTASFYALFGGAEDFAPAVYAVQDVIRPLLKPLLSG